MDSNAEQELSPEDSKKFNYFVFGGILVDNPPQKRTEKLIGNLKQNNIKFGTRNLGKKQMSTDTAVYVTKKVLGGTEFKKIRFGEEIEIETHEGESAILPFRYVIENDKPIISKKLIDYLRKKEGF